MQAQAPVHVANVQVGRGHRQLPSELDLLFSSARSIKSAWNFCASFRGETRNSVVSSQNVGCLLLLLSGPLHDCFVLGR